MSKRPSHYQAYLIHMWADDQQPPTWRFSAENIHTRSRRGFSNLEELVAFLENSIGESSPKGKESFIENDESE